MHDLFSSSFHLQETTPVKPASPSSVSFPYLGGTRTKRVASGLKSGVSAKRRNRLRMRWRRGRRLASPRPRLRRSASLSTSSEMSRVNRQSNSPTVHLRWSRTSRRSSTLSSGASSASYSSCFSSVRGWGWRLAHGDEHGKYDLALIRMQGARTTTERSIQRKCLLCEYLKLACSVCPRCVDLRHLPVPHLPLLWGRHELQHAPRAALLREEAAANFNLCVFIVHLPWRRSFRSGFFQP